MPKKSPTPLKQQAGRRSKDDIEMLEREAGSYYLLIEAIMADKHLSWEIVHRWLQRHGFVLLSKSEADAEILTLAPNHRKAIEKGQQNLEQAKAKADEREKRLMDLVR